MWMDGGTVSKPLDCVVIGAGAAGLAAAAMLHEAGRSFVILEARDRSGGRAHSIALSDGSKAERGAQYLHGARISTWEYVARYGLTTHFAAGPVSTIIPEFRDGEWRVDGYPETAAALGRLEAAFDIPDAAHVSVYDALQRAGFAGYELEAAESRMRVMTPCDPRAVSAAGGATAFQLVAPVTANFMLVEGYRELWERMSTPFQDAIRFETPVTSVDWPPDGVTVTAVGERHAARTAIVTLPIGVLQSGTIAFQPPLPDWKQAAIDGLRAGTLVKFVAEFRRPFWEDFLGVVVNFRSSSHPFSTFGVVYWDRPGPPALVAFLGAQPALDVSGDPARAEHEYISALTDMFPEVDIRAELVRLEIADWTADPWARCALSVEVVGGAHVRAELGKATPPLFWAGEATATDGGAECVHGALTTGRQAALDALHLLRPLSITEPASRLDWSRYVR
jgi:monoamine oxidase